MKRIILFTLLALTFSAAEGREVRNLNRGWQFYTGAEASSDGAQTVNLPYIWNNDALGGKKDYYRGNGNYQRRIHIPAEWRNKRVFIRLYGANSVATVLVNSSLAGEHKGGYTAFVYEITDLLKYGDMNDFRIIVSNADRTDVLPTAGDANSYGGLFRDVELVITGKEIVSLTDNGGPGVYVKQGEVTRERVTGETLVKVSGRGDNTVQAVVAVRDAAGNVVSSGTARVRLSGNATSDAVVPFTINAPHLWNGTADPYLYDVQVKIMDGNKVMDSLTVKTGFRTLEADAKKGFLLNGEPYRLRGVNVTQDRAMVGTALTIYQVEEDFRLIRDMGANAVRIMGVAHHPYFYELCDREGIIVWSDFPLVGAAYLTDLAFVDTHEFRSNGQKQASEIMAQQFNNPAVAMWGVFSRLRPRGDNPADYISQLNMVAKRDGGGRLTVAASNTDGDINFITDLILWAHHFGWREGRPEDIGVWSKQIHAQWPQLKSAVGYSAGASILHQGEELERPDPRGNWHPERWQTHLHEKYMGIIGNDPGFWGIFVGNMFDYGAAGRTWGEGNGINDHGLVTFDRKYCKDAYYLYKALWNKEDKFIYIAEKRWDRRRDRKQSIRVYTNCDEVELRVNGQPVSSLGSKDGVMVWDVELQNGANYIEARHGSIMDAARIEVGNVFTDRTMM